MAAFPRARQQRGYAWFQGWMALVLATGCGDVSDTVVLECDSPSAYCVSRIETAEFSGQGRLVFRRLPSSGGIFIAGDTVFIEDLHARGGASVFEDFRYLGVYETDWHNVQEAWVPLRPATRSELALEYVFSFSEDITELEIWHRYPESYDAPRTVDVHLLMDARLAYTPEIDSIAFALDYWGMHLGRITVSSTEIPTNRSELAEWTPPSVDGGRPVVTVAAVQDISDQNVLGYAFVGPPQGSRNFVIYEALDLESSPERAQEERLLLAHEFGHLGGLLHSTDQYGSDALDDTPDCDQQTFDAHPDQCPDRNNVMFANSSGMLASPTQVQIMQESLLSRPVSSLRSSTRTDTMRESTPTRLIGCRLGD